MNRGIALVAGGLLLVGAGAFGMYLYQAGGRETAPAPDPAAPAATPDPTPVSHEIAMTLTPEAVSRAGILTSAVRPGSSARAMPIPAVVEPNAYRQTLVTAAVAGQVLSVPAELGAHVRPGQTLATIHSPDLAEAERVYLSMQAELTAVHQRLTRLEALVKIGAASRQELEAAEVEHTTHTTDVEGARARLLLLGVSADAVKALVDPSRINPVLTVVAPEGGVVTRRAINRGQRVDASAELFTIVDLATVWIVGDLYERDLGRVRVGSRATMTSPALPRESWTGAVTYIDPQVAPETRTARLRVETANPGERLRLGMYLDMTIDGVSAKALLAPRSAVQVIGNQSVVYAVDPAHAGRFVERSVRLGVSSGEDVEVLAGLADGDRIVTTGSFFLRAERDRLGLPPPVPPAPSPGPPAEGPARVEIAVTKEGFVPDRVTAAVGRPIELVFIRTVADTCATEVVVPSLNVRKALPLKKPVVVRITPRESGEIAFACGMNMLRGAVVVR
jgi:cobalt-zinc-cadmium efflux system membrane fusion protein